jgi:hypothetical protein
MPESVTETEALSAASVMYPSKAGICSTFFSKSLKRPLQLSWHTTEAENYRDKKNTCNNNKLFQVMVPPFEKNHFIGFSS